MVVFFLHIHMHIIPIMHKGISVNSLYIMYVLTVSDIALADWCLCMYNVQVLNAARSHAV